MATYTTHRGLVVNRVEYCSIGKLMEMVCHFENSSIKLHELIIMSLGHDWPSKSRNINMLVAGMGPQPIEANELIVEFFNQYSLV